MLKQMMAKCGKPVEGVSYIWVFTLGAVVVLGFLGWAAVLFSGK